MRWTSNPRFLCSLLVKPRELILPCFRASGSIILIKQQILLKITFTFHIQTGNTPQQPYTPVIPTQNGLKTCPQLNKGRKLWSRVFSLISCGSLSFLQRALCCVGTPCCCVGAPWGGVGYRRRLVACTGPFREQSGQTWQQIHIPQQPFHIS